MSVADAGTPSLIAGSRRDRMREKIGVRDEAAIFEESRGFPQAYLVLCAKRMKSGSCSSSPPMEAHSAAPAAAVAAFVFNDTTLLSTATSGSSGGGVERKRRVSSRFVCRKCKSGDVIWKTQQTRSLDEPEKVFITCQSCGALTTISG